MVWRVILLVLIARIGQAVNEDAVTLESCTKDFLTFSITNPGGAKALRVLGSTWDCAPSNLSDPDIITAGMVNVTRDSCTSNVGDNGFLTPDPFIVIMQHDIRVIQASTIDPEFSFRCVDPYDLGQVMVIPAGSVDVELPTQGTATTQLTPTTVTPLVSILKVSTNDSVDAPVPLGTPLIVQIELPAAARIGPDPFVLSVTTCSVTFETAVQIQTIVDGGCSLIEPTMTNFEEYAGGAILQAKFEAFRLVNQADHPLILQCDVVVCHKREHMCRYAACPPKEKKRTAWMYRSRREVGGVKEKDGILTVENGEVKNVMASLDVLLTTADGSGTSGLVMSLSLIISSLIVHIASIC